MKECIELEDSITEIHLLSDRFAEYVCETPKSFNLEEHLNIFKRFCDNLKKAKEVRFLPFPTIVRQILFTELMLPSDHVTLHKFICPISADFLKFFIRNYDNTK